LIIKNSCNLQCAYVNNSCSKEEWRERKTLKKDTRTSAEKRENERTSCSKETWRKRRTLKKDRRTSEERQNERKERKNGKKENEGRVFFHFPFVPNMFPSSSQWVPIKFPICSLGSQCVPQGCSQSHMFCPKSSPSHLYRWAKGGGTPSSHRIFYFGQPP
jgi:hypothetical protein